MIRLHAVALPLLVALTSCHTHPHEEGGDAPRDEEEDDAHGHAHGGDAIAVTSWTEQTELFVEFPPLVVGRDSPFAAHLTMLDDFSPVAAGHVEVVLSGGGAPEERFKADPSSTAGIFRPVAHPTKAAKRNVTVILDTDAGQWVHDLGPYRVHASADEVATSEDHEGGGEISFLKEQQWKVPFSTEVVTPEAVRPSFAAFAHLTARADGEVTVTAPATGRLLADPQPLPVVGATVTSGDLLAKFVPRLEGGADVPTLDLAITAARLDLEHATSERERLEGLLADGAVPQRRVVEARHAEATAKAALAAARRRSGQFRRVQRTGKGGKAGSVEIRTPLSGTVLEVNAVAGALVDDGAPLFRVVDASTLWLSAQVPEIDQARIPEVAGAWFTVPGMADPVEVGADAVVTRGGSVDPRTRTINVVFAVDNPQGRLRVGARVRAHLLEGQAAEVPTVPAPAVLFDAGTAIVFVQTGGESFERRQVQTGIRDAGRIEITDGLEVGERVVVRGAYAVKLASASTSPPAHGHAH